MEEVLADKLITRAEKDVTSPTIKSFSLANNASATRSSSPTIWLVAFDDISESENLMVQFKTIGAISWTTPQNARNVMSPNLTLGNGVNRILVRVIDESGNSVEDVITIFKI